MINSVLSFSLIWKVAQDMMLKEEYVWAKITNSNTYEVRQITNRLSGNRGKLENTCPISNHSNQLLSCEKEVAVLLNLKKLKVRVYIKYHFLMLGTYFFVKTQYGPNEHVYWSVTVCSLPLTATKRQLQ